MPRENKPNRFLSMLTLGLLAGKGEAANITNGNIECVGNAADCLPEYNTTGTVSLNAINSAGAAAACNPNKNDTDFLGRSSETLVTKKLGFPPQTSFGFAAKEDCKEVADAIKANTVQPTANPTTNPTTNSPTSFKINSPTPSPSTSNNSTDDAKSLTDIIIGAVAGGVALLTAIIIYSCRNVIRNCFKSGNNNKRIAVDNETEMATVSVPGEISNNNGEQTSKEKPELPQEEKSFKPQEDDKWQKMILQQATTSNTESRLAP